MTEIELLQQIGLNKYEAEAYYTLLSQGPLTGYELGKCSPVPLSRSYEILARLTQKGLALAQPGDPPRYTATHPDLFLGRVRTTMAETLAALTEALTSLPHADTAGEFWVIRGRQPILERTQAMIVGAHNTLDLHLPGQHDADIAHLQTVVHGQQRPVQTRLSLSDTREAPILLLIDGREALAGTLTPSEQCQAIVSTNAALVALLNRYFSDAPVTEKPALTPAGKTAQPEEHLDWIAWEERKHRRLWHVNTGNHVA
jgi:HTH-type transcriptional regulator, sugar sensing transcriptional regulator